MWCLIPVSQITEFSSTLNLPREWIQIYVQYSLCQNNYFVLCYRLSGFDFTMALPVGKHTTWAHRQWSKGQTFFTVEVLWPYTIRQKNSKPKSWSPLYYCTRFQSYKCCVVQVDDFRLSRRLYARISCVIRRFVVCTDVEVCTCSSLSAFNNCINIGTIKTDGFASSFLFITLTLTF
jgi:hypothetical protein